MKSIAERIHSYSDQQLESILMKRNGYQDALVIAAIEEAKLRGLIATDDEVNSKYPLIPGDENFGEDILKKISFDTAFQGHKHHYLLIGWFAVGFGFIGLLKGYFVAPILPAVYIYCVYRLADHYHPMLYWLVHVASYVLSFLMVIFIFHLIKNLLGFS